MLVDATVDEVFAWVRARVVDVEVQLGGSNECSWFGWPKNEPTAALAIPGGLRVFRWPETRWWQMGARGHYVDITAEAVDPGITKVVLRRGFGLLVAYGQFVGRRPKWWQRTPIRFAVGVGAALIAPLRHSALTGDDWKRAPFRQLAWAGVRVWRRLAELAAPAVAHVPRSHRLQRELVNELYGTLAVAAIGEGSTSPHRRLALR